MPEHASDTIEFDAVRLDFEIERLGGTKGLATANTSRFARSSGNVILLDCRSGLVTITHTSGNGKIVVPRERVKYFEALPEPA